MRRRLAIVAAALLPRLTVGAITFGSEDAVACLRNSVAVLQGAWADTPYLPFIELWLAVASRIAHYTGAGVTFPYKLLPIAGDALLALLLYDAEADPRRGLRNALLYALSPVTICISAVHMQWDSIWMHLLLLALLLLRVQRPFATALAGAALVLSVVVKPIALPLAVVLVPLTRRGALSFLSGSVATAAIYAAVLAAVGWLLSFDHLLQIGRYAHRGVQLFGLPYLPVSRLWIALAMLGALWLLTLRRKITREEAVFFFFCAVIATAGLSPQYLCWIVPFAIVAGRVRFLAAYTLVAGTFLVLYYRVPLLNRVNADNLGGYGLVTPLGRFSPHLAEPELQSLARLLGNYVLPLFCLGYVVYATVRLIGNNEPRGAAVAHAGAARLLAPAAIVAIAVLIAGVWAATRPPIEPRQFIERVERKIVTQYDVVRFPYRVPGRGKVWVPRSTMQQGYANRHLHAANVAIFWVIAAAGLTFLWRERPAG